MKPRELAEILLRMAESDENIEVVLEDNKGITYPITEVCFNDYGNRYEISISAIPQQQKKEEKEGKGLTGWLSPEGIFYPCLYGEHYKLATEIVYGDNHLNRQRIRIGFEKDTVINGDDTLKELHWIPMGVPKWGSQNDMDYLYISLHGRTQAQIDWFEQNYQYLSEPQKEKLEEHIQQFLELNK